jgi:hypothetical protein
LSYTVTQISIEGSSEFSRHPIGSNNSGDKKTKTKNGAVGFAFFGYFFGEAKK